MLSEVDVQHQDYDWLTVIKRVSLVLEQIQHHKLIWEGNRKNIFTSRMMDIYYFKFQSRVSFRV